VTAPPAPEVTVLRYRRRRCRACRHQWDSLATGPRVMCPKCRTWQDTLARRKKRCRWCGYSWRSASVLDTVRCPACSRNTNPKWKRGETRTCPRCAYTWQERKPSHPKRPRCPVCFVNLKTVARGKKTK